MKGFFPLGQSKKILLEEIIAESGIKHLDNMKTIRNGRGKEWVIISKAEIKE